MKKYFVIGNPIDHSLSPKLHNYWLNQNNINAVYEKVKLEENEIENFLNLGSDGEKYVINENQQNEMSFSIISTNFTPDICRKVEFENLKYSQLFMACKRGETWSFQLLE